MPELDSTTLEKIDELRTLSNNWGAPIAVYQLLKISWETEDPIYYAVMDVGEMSPTLPVSPVEARLICSSYPDYFLQAHSRAALSDDEIDIEMWDGDDEFSQLVYDNGEGVKAEVFFWFPAVELLLSTWWGHLRTSEDSDSTVWRGKISNGFRSPNISIPNRAHYPECQAIFGGMLETQEEIDASGCPYNRHLVGGTVGNLNSGVPFTSCPRKTFAQCTDRIGDKLSHLSHQSVEETLVNFQTKGPALLATSRGNETNLKRPVRVVMGARIIRDLDLLASLAQHNTKTPDRGFWRVIFEMCEGPIEKVISSHVNGQHCQSSSNAISLNVRLGQARQAPTSFSPNVHNYSRTALFSYVYGWVNPNDVKAEDLKGEAHIYGLNDIKQFTDSDSYTTGWTNVRAWHILRMLTDRIWGYGLDEARINIDSFIECATWGHQLVNFTDPDTGEVLQHCRSMSDVDLQERTTQQQIEDMCWAGRFSRPFLFQGKLNIVPLKALTEEELEECPVFTDFGESRNIIFENEKSSLRYSQKSDADTDFHNRIELTYDDYEKYYKEAIISVDDQDQQLAAGRVTGDKTLRKIPKKESALGVVENKQARKLAWALLDLGKFDEGGLQNNLEVKFKAWYLDCLTLHEYKVIKVLSNKITKYGFEYFRIKEINPLPNLQREIICQAYPVSYMNDFETTLMGPPSNPEPEIPDEVIPLEFGDIVYQNGYLEVEIVAGS